MSTRRADKDADKTRRTARGTSRSASRSTSKSGTKTGAKASVAKAHAKTAAKSLWKSSSKKAKAASKKSQSSAASSYRYLSTGASFGLRPEGARQMPIASRSKVTAKPSKRVAAAQARLATLPTGFTDWIHDMPAWPGEGQEVLGPVDELNPV